MELRGLKVVITGASHGLGKALAEKLSELHAELYLISRSIDKIPLPFKATRIKCDIRDPRQVEEAFKKLPEFDILINCVGIPLVKSITASSPEEIHNTIQTNLTGLIYTCKYSIPKLENSKSPFIVNIISTSGKKARANETVYCASKWGLSGFTNSLRLELAPKGIRAIGVYPGGMKSEHFWKGIKTKEEIQDFIPLEEMAEYIIRLLEVAENSTPAEVVIERKVK